MKKLAFVVDDVNDPELLSWIYSLGRSRSLVINNLLRQCMASGGIPITGAANAAYDNTNLIREQPVQRVSKQDKQLEVREKTEHNGASDKNSPDKSAHLNENREEVAEQQNNQHEDREDYVSAAPKICDENLVMNMMSAFGGM